MNNTWLMSSIEINVVTYIILAYETAKFNIANSDHTIMWPTFNNDSPLAGMLFCVYVYGCVEVRTLSIFKIGKHFR